ncbi:MAG: ABC transporter substrate-binding protein [Deltaproteobacteria bacterium]|nr:MAG: ABC transporter substrate-binding protein [Deltaproteobacteria bacterium]
MRETIACKLIVLSFVLIFGLPAVSQAQKLVVGYSGITAIQAPFWIIKDAGYFKQEGLDANLIYIAASSTMAQAMMAGEVAISTANSQAIVDTGLQGGDLVAVGAIVNFVALYVIAAPEIKTVQDLRGKPVGVTRFGATTDFAMQMFLQKYGLEPVRDVPIIQIGVLPELAAGLSNKSIYAAAMSYPMGLVAQQAGMKMLANLAKEQIPFLHQGLTTTARFMRERRPQAKAFVRAYGKAVHFMHTRKEESKAIVSRYTKVTDPGMLEGTIQYAYDFVEKIPLVKREAIQVTLDESGKKNPKAKQAKLEQFYDNSLVQELINEGFFASLWGK